MADLVAADVTVTVSKRKRGGSGIKIHFGTIAFGDGVDTVPTAGIPMPTAASFGFDRAIDDIQITGVNGLTTDYITSYNKATNKLQLFENAAAANAFPESGDAVAARTYSFIAWGW